MDAQRLLDGTEDGVHRVERTVGVLEHRLNVAAETEQILGLERGGVAAFVEHLAGSGLQEVKHHVRHGGLAGTGFAHDGQGGAALDGEGHVVDGLEHLLLAGQLEFLGQVVDGDDVLAFLKRAFAGDVVVKQGVRVLTALLGGDDALGGQRRGGGHESLGVRVLRVLQHLEGPLYITTMCWARSAARPRSWVMNSTAVPSESVSMCRWSRMRFCTVTSRAEVGSSAISRSGRQARPMAMSARWRIPPES